METRIKKWGDSKVIVLSPEFCQYQNLEVGDWVNISDIFKLENKNE